MAPKSSPSCGGNFRSRAARAWRKFRPLITRAKTLAHLVEAAPGPVSDVRATKLLFLLSQGHDGGVRLPASATYQFLPYLHGPYSFTLAHELEGLLAVGELRRDGAGRLVRPPGAGAVKLAVEFKTAVAGVVRGDGRLSTRRLVDLVYERHPWFTVNADDARRRGATLPVRVPLQVDGFLNLLLEGGIRRLIDVRANPVSRKFGFHGSTLRRLCGKVGLDYAPFPELGIASTWRAGLDASGQEGYAALFRRYEAEVLPARSTEVLQVAARPAPRRGPPPPPPRPPPGGCSDGGGTRSAGVPGGRPGHVPPAAAGPGGGPPDRAADQRS